MFKYIMLIVCSIMLLNCVEITYIPPPPTVIVIANDQTATSKKYQTPKLQQEDIDKLLELVLNLGGSINYLEITENSYLPITRLDLEPTTDKTLKERAFTRQKQQQEIEAFNQKVAESITSERNKPWTDLWGAIKRVDRLFREISNDKSKRYLLLISDCLDDAKKHKPLALPGDIKVILVGNINEKIAEQIGGQVVAFEGLNAAVNYIIKSAKGVKNGNKN